MPDRSQQNPQQLEYPLVPIRDVVLFPETLVSFRIGRVSSLSSLEMALATDRNVFLVTQRQPELELPTREDLFDVGVVAEVETAEELDSGTRKVIVKVKTRGRLITIRRHDGGSIAVVESVPSPRDNEKPVTEIMQRVARLVQNYLPIFQEEFKDNLKRSLKTSNPSVLADRVISWLPLVSVEDKQRLLETFSSYERLQRIVHLLETGRVASQPLTATSVFIGHGRNPLWARVQLFLQNELGLNTINYESESRVGASIVPVLEKMLDESGFAVLIFTAEDESGPGIKRARQNVVHEAGLFQGRLGFRKVVLLVQEGLEEFTNVAGLQHIRFSGERIDHTFYELQRVLKREGLL